MAHHLNYTTGAIVAIGGSLGYLKAKSIPSLVAGVGMHSFTINCRVDVSPLSLPPPQSFRECQMTANGMLTESCMMRGARSKAAGRFSWYLGESQLYTFFLVWCMCVHVLCFRAYMYSTLSLSLVMFDEFVVGEVAILH